MDASNSSPKRGRPPKYSPEEKLQAYKDNQKERDKIRYQTNSQSIIKRNKEVADRYRHAFKILQHLWDRKEITNTSIDSAIQDLLEHKTITDF